MIPSVRSPYPVRGGNLLRAWVDGMPAFERICQRIEAAESSVWATVAFLREGFTMPGGRGGLLDVLDAAVARGVDVRVLFWEESWQRRFLAVRGSAAKIRWDAGESGFCQHQKTWIVDAGCPGEVAFVGGINCNPRAVVHKGHPGPASTHDAYVELAGPSATDVHRNFVQRWNAAAGPGADDLPAPVSVSGGRGDSVVQIQRTVHGRERSILDQYLAAIAHARRTIYLENQYLAEETVIAALAAACDRGVSVIAVVPVEPDRPGPPELRAPLVGRKNLLLAGLRRENAVYVHDKLMIVDDEWTTIGSANIHRPSMFGNTELNASVWDPGFARGLRAELFAEHLGEDTGDLTDEESFQRFTEVAADPSPQSLATTLDLRTYQAGTARLS